MFALASMGSGCMVRWDIATSGFATWQYKHGDITSNIGLTHSVFPFDDAPKKKLKKKMNEIADVAHFGNASIVPCSTRCVALQNLLCQIILAAVHNEAISATRRRADNDHQSQ